MRAVYFDLDDTLVTFDRGYGDVLSDALAVHLDDVDDGLLSTYDDAFFEAFSAVETEPYLAGARAVAAASAEPVDPAAFVDTLRETETAAAVVRDGVRAVLDRLDDRPLGVLTNGLSAWQVGKLERTGLLDRFDAVVASYEAGAHKPDPAAFELAADRLPADGHVMVGDDHACDVAGARAAGWRAVHLDGGDEDHSLDTASAREAFLDALD